MPLTKCPKCGSRVSNKATRCPHCCSSLQQPQPFMQGMQQPQMMMQGPIFSDPRSKDEKKAFVFDELDSSAKELVENGGLILSILAMILLAVSIYTVTQLSEGYSIVWLACFMAVVAAFAVFRAGGFTRLTPTRKSSIIILCIDAILAYIAIIPIF